MATAASKELYPLSTNDAKAIPLDIVLPLELLFATIALNVATDLTIPTTFDTVAIYSTVDLILDFSNLLSYPLASGLKNSALIVPAQTIITAKLPSVGAINAIPINADESGWLTIQSIQKWAGLGLQRQLQNR